MLSQKWAILYLLHQLANSDKSQEFAENPLNEGAHDLVSGRSGRVQDADDETFRDAFAGAGLPQLPSHQQQAPLTSVRPGSGGHRIRARERQPETPNGVHSPAQEDPAQGKAPSEAALLRDLPFTLQGLSASNLRFASHKVLELPSNLPLPIISILHTLAEPSLLYRGLSDFVESHDNGLIGQSLRSAISGELRSYLGLISTLESEIRQALTVVEGGSEQIPIGKAGVTLKRCVIWTREATMGLRLMSIMVEEAKSKLLSQAMQLISHSSKVERAASLCPKFMDFLRLTVTLSWPLSPKECFLM